MLKCRREKDARVARKKITVSEYWKEESIYTVKRERLERVIYQHLMVIFSIFRRQRRRGEKRKIHVAS